MRISRRLHNESGSALIEFLLYGLILQVGALTLFVNLTTLQASQLAAESIARHGLRAFVNSNVDPNETALQVASDFQIQAKPILKLFCDPNCQDQGSTLRLQVKLNSAVASSVFIR